MSLTLTVGDITNQNPITPNANYGFHGINAYSLTASDAGTPLVDDEKITFQVEIASFNVEPIGFPNETPGDSRYAFIPAWAASGVAIATYICPQRAGAIRFRVERQGVQDWTDWSTWSLGGPEITTPPPAYPNRTNHARYVSFNAVMNSIRRRLALPVFYYGDDTWQLLTEFIDSAYRICFNYLPWPEAEHTYEVDIANGLVTRSAVYGGEDFKFFTADPRTPESEAVRINVNRVDDDGIWLETTADSCWVVVRERSPSFTYQNRIYVYDNQHYYRGEYYYGGTGDYYECTSDDGVLADLSNTDNWKPMRILFVLEEPLKLMVMAMWRTREQEHGQAATLQRQAQEALRDIADMTFRPVPNPRSY